MSMCACAAARQAGQSVRSLWGGVAHMRDRPLWGRQGRSRTATLAADAARGRVRITARVKAALTTALVMVPVLMRSTQAVWRASLLRATVPPRTAAMTAAV